MLILVCNKNESKKLAISESETDSLEVTDIVLHLQVQAVVFL